MKNKERNSESKLETSIALATGVGLTGTFQYNLYRILDNFGYFDQMREHTEYQGLGQFSLAEDTPQHLVNSMYHAGSASLLGGLALFVGGIKLGSYIFRKLKK